MVIRTAIILLGILLSLASPVLGEEKALVVLFTSDLHSRMEPSREGKGGIGNLAGFIEKERKLAAENGDALLLIDGGDMAMGTVYHTAFCEDAIEYRALARLGYDAITFGNHDFDYGVGALRKMYETAHSKDPALVFPQLLSANLVPVDSSGSTFWKGMVRSWSIFERNGIKVGVFGVMGENAYNVIGKDSGVLEFTPMAEAAAKSVASLKREGADYIIAISHGGTLNGDDLSLVKKVPGIDFVLSAHDHILLRKPQVMGKTYIGAVGAFGEFVGKIVFRGGKVETYAIYGMVGEEDGSMEICRWRDSLYACISSGFETSLGMGTDDTLAILGEELPKEVAPGGTMDLGQHIAQSYADEGVRAFPPFSEKIIGVVPYGLVRCGLVEGAVTAKDAFEVLSLGENEDGFTGYPLVYAWLNGREVKDLCELSHSVAPYLEDTRLFLSGVEYTYNSARPPFFKVTDLSLHGKRIADDSLYMVVTGEYTANLIGLMKEESFGLLSAVPKDSAGNVMENGTFPKITDGAGKAIPEWRAFAGYLKRGGLYDGRPLGGAVEEKSVPAMYILFAVGACLIMGRWVKKKVVKG